MPPPDQPVPLSDERMAALDAESAEIHAEVVEAQRRLDRWAATGEHVCGEWCPDHDTSDLHADGPPHGEGGLARCVLCDEVWPCSAILSERARIAVPLTTPDLDAAALDAAARIVHNGRCAYRQDLCPHVDAPGSLIYDDDLETTRQAITAYLEAIRAR